MIRDSRQEPNFWFIKVDDHARGRAEGVKNFFICWQFWRVALVKKSMPSAKKKVRDVNARASKSKKGPKLIINGILYRVREAFHG